jgi:hypothetical protein
VRLLRTRAFLSTWLLATMATLSAGYHQLLERGGEKTVFDPLPLTPWVTRSRAQFATWS